MHRSERHVCRRHQVAAGGEPLPFALPGARPTFTPDRSCDVRHLRIEVVLDFDHGRVDGACTLTLVPLNDGPTPVALDAVEMTIASVSLADGSHLAHRYDGRALRFDLGERREGEAVDVTVRYQATPRRGLYFIRPDEAYPALPLQAWTQGQDEDNRCWFPCFDHPTVKSTSEVIATVPERMTVLSNGTRAEETVAAGRRTVRFRHEVPHSSYLVTLVAGEYTRLGERAAEVALDYYVAPDRAADAPRSFANTPAMMALFAAKTGHPYPYPSYAQITVAEFIFGGMENTSATTLTDQTLHDARAHLDYSSEPLVAHELAHQWFGDLITCRDWSHGWLNEGFATYFELVWKEHSAGRDDADYDRLGDLEAYLEEDRHRYRRPIVTHVFHEPIDVFDRHLYEKGGLVLHMLRCQLGEARFWKAVRHYLAKHRGGSVETRDLARAIDEATGWNPDGFFDQWLFKAGYPELKVEYAWDDEHGQVRLKVEQAQKVEKETPLFRFPLTVRLVAEGAARTVTLAVSAAQETFVIPLGAEPSQVIVDPGFQLLAALEVKKPSELWCEELQAAPLAIDRVRAARALGAAADPLALGALGRALVEDQAWMVRGEAGLGLGALKSEAARAALVAALGREQHPKARRQLVKALGSFRHDERAADALAALLRTGDASYFVEAESAMSLAKTRSSRAFAALEGAMDRPAHLDVIRSMCLSGMAELRDERGIDVALRAARRGQPATARRAAISVLGALGAEHAGRRRAVREALEELLEDADFRARIAAVEALRVLGERDAVGALERATLRDLDGRVRRRAREVARALGEDAPAGEQLHQLRDSLEKLEDENRGLKERLAALEARAKDGGHDR